MRFRIELDDSTNVNRSLVYRTEEFAFDTVPSALSACTSILLDDLNLEVDEAGEVVAIWGLSPHTQWKHTQLNPPDAPAGRLIALTDAPLQSGVSLRATPVGKHLNAFIDTDTGWIMVNNNGAPASSVLVFTGFIIELDIEGQISAAWLRPVPEVDGN